MRDGAGNSSRVIGVVSDISESKRRAEHNALVLEASAALASGQVNDAALGDVLAAMLPRLGDVALFELVEGESVRRIARADQPALRQLIERVGCPPQGGGPAQLRQVGLHSRLSVPLSYQQRTLGRLTLAFRREGAGHDDQHREIVQEIADRVAAALTNARLYRELERSESEAQAAYAEARAAARRKDEFLAMLGHELRNPLAPITTALELMRRSDERSFAHERTIIERQVEHLVRLVDDLLDVSRITRGKIEIKRRPVELATVVGRALEMASPLLDRRRQRIELAVPREGLLVNGDEHRLAQVLSNVLTNASKYSDPEASIGIEATREDGDVVVRVIDAGSGIEPEMLPELFDLFAQGASATDRAQGGLGLGLAIVKSLVELHQGTVTVESEGRGRGTTVAVRLPAIAPPASGVFSIPSGTFEPSTPRRVLVVDDNRDLAETLGALLEREGHEVCIAHDGPGALDLVDQFQAEVALIDIGLPVMDGHELALRLRQQVGDELLLIAISGYGQERDRERSIHAGFAEHLVKPVDVDQMLGLLEDLSKGE